MEKRELLLHIYGYLKPKSTYKGARIHDLSYVSNIIEKYANNPLDDSEYEYE